MKFLARFFIGFLSILILFSALAIPFAFAKDTTPQQSSTQSDVANYILPQTDANVPHDLHTFSQSIFIEALSALTCQLGGVDIATRSHECLTYNPMTGKISYAPSNGGLVAITSNAISALFTPPFHTSDYVGYMASNFGFAKHAYAATAGFDQLSPLAKIWVGFRNIVYLLFVVVFVVIGFAIMIRAKIDPRTVMTIENQIPKIIVALILVTFSFAIAGLLIDMMWLTIYIIVNFFGSLDPRIPVNTIVVNLHQNPFAFVNNSFGNGGILQIALRSATSVYDTLNAIVTGMVNVNVVVKGVVSVLGWLNIVDLMACTLRFPPDPGGSVKCINDSLVTATAFIGATIAFLVFLFALLAALFKLLFALLRAYVLFLMYVVLGPFFIMLGVLPGSKINFEHWLRHILAYLFVFPTTISILLLGQLLADAMGSSQVGFVPPLLGSDQTSSSVLGPLIGFAILMLLPSTLAMVEDFFAAPPFKFLPQIGQGLAAGGSIVTGGFNRAIWDPLFRERNIATGAQEGLVRGFFTGRISNQNSPAWIRGLGRWFGLRREAEGPYK
ncbi:MAG TPA: hypothetical protein VF189_04770 [Patescibacteria group bacterium]